MAGAFRYRVSLGLIEGRGSCYVSLFNNHGYVFTLYIQLSFEISFPSVHR